MFEITFFTAGICHELVESLNELYTCYSLLEKNMLYFIEVVKGLCDKKWGDLVNPKSIQFLLYTTDAVEVFHFQIIFRCLEKVYHGLGCIFSLELFTLAI